MIVLIDLIFLRAANHLISLPTSNWLCGERQICYAEVVQFKSTMYAYTSIVRKTHLKATSMSFSSICKSYYDLMPYHCKQDTAPEKMSQREDTITAGSPFCRCCSDVSDIWGLWRKVGINGVYSGTYIQHKCKSPRQISKTWIWSSVSYQRVAIHFKHNGNLQALSYCFQN